VRLVEALPPEKRNLSVTRGWVERIPMRDWRKSITNFDFAVDLRLGGNYLPHLSSTDGIANAANALPHAHEIGNEPVFRPQRYRHPLD
jgi:hypothetical protein